MSFAAGLGPETRGDIDLFVQALRDRFTHRTPAETVRASLNNIKKKIQRDNSRIRFKSPNIDGQGLPGHRLYRDLYTNDYTPSSSGIA